MSRYGLATNPHLSIYNPELQLTDHRRPVTYEMVMPPEKKDKIDPERLFILRPKGRHSRAIDDAIETFVDETRMGTVV